IQHIFHTYSATFPPSTLQTTSALNRPSSSPSLVQIFNPNFHPFCTGNPAWSVLSSPTFFPFPPTSLKFRQNTAFPGTGRNVTPSSHPASQFTTSHHLSSRGASSSGNCVPPPTI